MNTTITIILDRKGRAKEGQESMLDVRVTCKRKTIYISTGIKVRKSEWVAGRVVNRLDASVINDRLAIIYKKVGREVNAALDAGRKLNVNEIRKRVFDVKEYIKGDAMIRWINEQIPLLDIKDTTRKHYYTLADRLEEFGKMRQWEDVTVDNICEFDAFLHTRRKPVNENAAKAGVKALKLSDAGIFNYHKCLKALLRRADRFGKIDRNPYDRLRGLFKRGEVENPEYLTDEEIRKIRTLDLETGSPLAAARDLFLFQTYTGLAYSDAQAFSFRRYKQVEGVWKYTGHRTKTGVAYISQLLPPVVDILQKYGGNVPKIGNADYNHRLKEIQRMAGIDTRLHSHLARHTFATLMLANGAKIENVKQMLGHKSIITTQKYAKVLATSVYEDYEKFRTKMCSQF